MKYLTLTLYILIVVFAIIMFMKNENTFRNQMRISDAIYRYNCDCLKRGREYYLKEKVEWYEMEAYDKTLFRLWDWGYTRILPPDRFELIKPFIQ